MVLKTTNTTPSRYGRRSAQTRRPTRRTCGSSVTLPFKPQDDANLRVLGIVEGAEVRRAEVRLDIDRQERIERVPDADTEPWLETQDLDVAFDAGFEPEVRREAQHVAWAHVVERLRRRRPGEAIAPVGDADDEPFRPGREPRAGQQPVRRIGRRGRVLVAAEYRPHDGVEVARHGVEIGTRTRSRVRDVDVRLLARRKV